MNQLAIAWSSDRSVRFLHALGGASTSRVLNLVQIGRINKENPEHAEKPMFRSPIINTSFILKHRIRSDESYMFSSARPVATKIIIPFDQADLRAGGRSIFIDQRGFLDSLRDAGNYKGDMLDRDLQVLRLLNAIPSLDPFLLREHLRNNDIDVASCYFTISKSDQHRMHEFVSGELAKLISMASGGSKSDAGTDRMVSALLSSKVDEKLEPLRITLGLSSSDFREGVFSWRGFLYYKWSMASFWPDVMRILKEVNQIQPYGPVDFEQKAFLSSARRNIIEMVRNNGNHISKVLRIYDESFGDLVARHSPKTFRDFLLSAPYMFVELGEKMGVISHIVSFWRYRFPVGVQPKIDIEELSAVFQDFTSGFADRIKEEPSVIKQPMVIEGLFSIPGPGNFCPPRALDWRPHLKGTPNMKLDFSGPGHRRRRPGRRSLPPLPQARPRTPAELLHDANNTVDNLKHDPAFGTARTMLQNARAVYIVPKLVKGGFIFGAEGGDGVLLVRNGHGWSAPKFYGMGSASFGLQIGLEQAQLVFIINSEAALKGIEKGNVKLGAGAGLTVVNLSSGAEGATTTHGGDIVVWTSGSGAYAGLTFNGSVIKEDKEMNAAPAPVPEAEALRKNLASVW